MKIEHRMFYTAKIGKKEKGVAVLPLVIISSFIILIVGAAVAFVTFFENQMAFSARKAGEALTAASAGINDALQKILRDRNYSTSSYSLTIDGNTAEVTITKGAACAGSLFMAEEFTVDSLGKAQNRQKKIRASVRVDCDTGQVVVASIKEIEI